MAVRIADTLKQQNNLTTFPVAYGEDIWLDENKGSGTADYDSLQNLYNDGKLGGSSIQVTIMPAASEKYLDTVLLYIGETGTYKYGTYYKCISDGETPPTYSWVDAEIGGGTKIFYGTMEEWDALSTDAKKQYDYMSDNNAGGSYIDTYSTNEVKTNKIWIDGKPIYRRVVVSATSTNIDVTSWGIDTPLPCYGCADYGGETLSIPRFGNNKEIYSWQLSRSQLSYVAASWSSIWTNAKIVCEYTKTTD